MAKYNVHAGHNPDGKVACGAVGLIKESTEARKVASYVISYLRTEKHTVYDCTCNNGTSASNVLKKIVQKCNLHKVLLDVAIHFNCGVHKLKKDGKTTGAEVLVYASGSAAVAAAKRICKKINALGFKNRGVKVRAELYVLKNTKSPALLVECCFVDDKDDCDIYNAKKMGKAIAEGILGKNITVSTAIKVGDKVKIKSGAIYGGSSYGKKVGSSYIGKKYTVDKIQTNTHDSKKVKEARLKEINSWVPVSYLKK